MYFFVHCGSVLRVSFKSPNRSEFRKRSNIERVDPCLKNYIAEHAEQLAAEAALEAAALRTGTPAIVLGVSTGIMITEVITHGDDLLEFAQCTGDLKRDNDDE